MTYPLGAYESPADSKDFILVSQAPPPSGYPQVFTAQPMPSKPVQVGGTCTSFSSMKMKVSQEMKDESKILRLDALWLYHQQKHIDGIAGEGSTLRSAMQVLNKQGIPVIGAKDPVADAKRHAIAAYYSVPRTEAAFKACLTDARYGWFPIALPWATNWMRITTRNGAQLPEPRGFEGGHAIIAGGWDDRKSTVWRGRRGIQLGQTWQLPWGSNGFCFLPWEFLPLLWEAWKSVDQLTGGV